MLRIVEEKSTNNSTALRVDGDIAGQWVEVLRSSCEQAFQGDGNVIIDLTGVSFADHDGVRLLQQLERRRQVRIINSSPFLREQMKHKKKGLSSSRLAGE